MSIQSGILSPEPSAADAIRSKLRARREKSQRARVASGALWLTAGVCLDGAVVSFGVSAGLPPLEVLGAALLTTAVWAGSTAIVLARGQ